MVAAVSAPVTGPARCMGCADSILDLPHQCGGDRIPRELGWWCDCPEEECRRRQAGEWPSGDPWLSPAARKTR